MLFPQPLTHSLLVELSVSFLQKTTELLMTSTGPSDSTQEIR